MKAFSVIAAFLSINVLGLVGCQTVPVPSPDNVVTTSLIDSNKLDSDGDGVPDIIDECPNTPWNIVVDPNGCPASLLPKEGSVHAEYRGFYEEGSSQLTKEYLNELDKIAGLMEKYPDAFMSLEAHISEPESKLKKNLSNQTLSLARVEGVKNYLILKHKIDPNRIRTYTYGAERPIASNDEAERIKLNQRVYAVIRNDDYFLKDILKVEDK